MLMTVLPSHAGDDDAGVTWPRCDVDVESCSRQCSRVMLMMMLPKRLGCGVMWMPSHADDNAADSCSRWRCQGDLATM
jgi:hypothetical protein